MKILLTGAFGNVGSSIIEELSGRSHEVLCFDIPSEAAHKMAEELPKHFTVEYGNLADKKLLKTLMRDVEIGRAHV